MFIFPFYSNNMPYVFIVRFITTILSNVNKCLRGLFMKKLLNIYIFRREDGICLYHYPFSSIKIDPQLISGFLSAILAFMDELIPLRKMESGTFSREDYTIIIEHGKMVSGALVALSEDSDLKARLKECIKVFEDTYKDEIPKKAAQEGSFDEFTQFMKRVFATRIVEPFSIPFIVNHLPKDYPQDPITITLINTFDGVKSVLEISLLTKLPLETVAYEILELMNKGFVAIKFKCKKSDVFKATKRGIRALNAPSLLSSLPQELNTNVALKILSEIDGIRPVSEIVSELKPSVNIFTRYAGFLYQEGFIEYIPLYHLVALILRDTINLLLANSLKYLGKFKVVEIFKSTRKELRKKSDITELIELMDNMTIDFAALWKRITTGSMKDAFEIIKSLVKWISILRRKIRECIGDKVNAAINNKINAQIYSKYSLTYRDALLTIDLDTEGRRIGALRLFLDD